MEQKIFDVSEVNDYIKTIMDGDGLLSGLTIRGEISNYKVYPSGHHYFSLKDAGGAIRCVMFRGSAAALRFRPENGMKVLASGRVSVFPRDGAYQLYCQRLTPEGVGDLYVAFEQLKKKLQAEGLFDPAHKKPLPPFPQRIAIVTSAAGAAIHDMLRILGKRYPLAKVILLPVRVQGVEAPAEIAGAIRYVNRFQLADLIITGRGGGSMEDLWAFNDERVARMIYLSQIPVISAVGHEPDVTISDFVADLRAATPSNAAELAVPEQGELRERITALRLRLAQAEERRLKLIRQQVEKLQSARVLQNPKNYLEDRRLLLDFQQNKLTAAMRQLVLKKQQDFVARRTALEAMSPLKVLSRGYAMTRDSAGRVVTDAAALKPGEIITVTLRNGEVDAAVREIRGGSNP
ncbi:MAG TPA: exodeoxyribonuclease VII large subunit [Candidatus Avoscillospira stercoripullorum]|uniref:Exodeoxyribonuclease 7 large subunit n=1 Tax=Candidatus Avoscillospira stercoripullorum TaxID=2840709 RepID=A0A9D1AAB5_9FIRM|nr:exodeoxyribonuclease VII large subunit [Candidatus Avoscillospira stercoripullorum]